MKIKTKKTPVKKEKSPQKTVRRSSKILGANDPAPFALENRKGAASGLVICDHASNRVPASLKGMGLSKAELSRHIGWDIGAEFISKYVGKALDMPVILSGYSRLVVDLNRAPQHPECMPEESDHTVIPANANLSKQEKERRLKEIYKPYQDQIEKQINRFTKKKQVPLLLAIHSFTVEMDGVKRPWHISFLWNRQEKIAKQLIAEIRKKYPGLLVGENEPYSLKDERFKGSTISRHGEDRDIPYIFVEFRQDLVDTKEKAIQWAEMFIEAVKPVLENLDMLQERKAKPRK